MSEKERREQSNQLPEKNKEKKQQGEEKKGFFSNVKEKISSEKAKAFFKGIAVGVGLTWTAVKTIEKIKEASLFEEEEEVPENGASTDGLKRQLLE